jgi:hypothetical protein
MRAEPAWADQAERQSQLSPQHSMCVRQAVSERVEPARVEAVQPQTDQAARQSQLSPEHSICGRQAVSERAEPSRVEAALARAD